MKQLTTIPVVALLCLFVFNPLHAQVDLKIGPVGLLFKDLNLGIEFGVNENVGVEVTPGFSWGVLNFADPDDDYNGSILRIGANGRYYFNPSEKKLNGFYAGAYTRYAGGKYTFDDDASNTHEEIKSTRIAGGLLLGAKIVAGNERLIFDFGLGFGRAFVYDFEDQNDPSNNVDLSNVPFINFDLPINLKIGYRISGGSEK